MATKCKECGGSGQVVFTKERGGPVCNNCGGAGYMTAEIVQRKIASLLDHPSVYMGGPSQGNLKRAGRIVQYLEKEGIL